MALFAQNKDCPQISENASIGVPLTQGISEWHLAPSEPAYWPGGVSHGDWPLAPPDTLTYWFSPLQWERMLKAEADSLSWTDGKPYVARVLTAPNGEQFTKLCTGTKPCTDFEDNRLVCRIIMFNGVDKITDLPKKN